MYAGSYPEEERPSDQLVWRHYHQFSTHSDCRSLLRWNVSQTHRHCSWLIFDSNLIVKIRVWLYMSVIGSYDSVAVLVNNYNNSPLDSTAITRRVIDIQKHARYHAEARVWHFIRTLEEQGISYVSKTFKLWYCRPATLPFWSWTGHWPPQSWPMSPLCQCWTRHSPSPDRSESPSVGVSPKTASHCHLHLYEILWL